MRCPWCDRDNFIPEVVILNAEYYGGGSVHVECYHCRKVVQVVLERLVKCVSAEKSDRKRDDWGG